MICEINTIINVDRSKVVENVRIVPKINSDSISYDEFFKCYLLANKPCILTNVIKEWPCTKLWFENNSPNFKYFSKHYLNIDVTISNCKIRSYNAHESKTWKLLDYIDYWKCYKDSNYSDTMPLLYLKDWHLSKNTNEPFYIVPLHFASDWLNEYFSEKTDDDYKFVYMGPKGTWTPFHADVFTSFSWSVNIYGKKKWILFPPGEENSVKDNLGNLPYDVTKCEIQTPFIEIIQEVDEAIFIPSGWHHQVFNLQDTISINHNWVNGCNLLNMWKSLTANLDQVKKEISDFAIEMDDWIIHCQLMLKASFGLDFTMFYDFLQYIATKRIKFLNNESHINQFGIWPLGINHAIFDLQQIEEVLELFNQHYDISQLDINKNNSVTSEQLMLDIKSTLINYR